MMGEDLLHDITGTTGLYYYMTMKEFERAEERRGKRKSVKLSSEEKKQLHDNLKNNLSSIFSYNKLKKNVACKSMRINNYEDLFSFISKLSLFDFIKQAEKLDSSFDCVLFEGNQAWISKAETEHYRYFTKSVNHTIIGLDLIDLLEVYHNVSTSEAIEKAVIDFKIKFMEDVWLEKQNRKYLSNLTLIHAGKKRLSQEFPSLFQFINSHLKVLETLNVLGNINVKKQEFSFKEENLFFASTSYISGFLGNYTLSTTSKVINLFAVLGLIQKVKEEYIPPQLLHESKMIAEQRNLGNIISYYIVPNMIDVLDEAERRSEILIKRKFTYTMITRKTVSTVFGEDFASEVYVQEIQKDKKRRESLPSTLSLQLEKNLLRLLEDKGFATKKMVSSKYIQKTKVQEREKELDCIFTGLLEKHNLRYIKPSLKMKADFGLKKSEYVVLKK